jgi:UDP-N-acetylmuramate--alanine ligase
VVFLGHTKRIPFRRHRRIGMSGIAEVLLNLGFNVSGSDMKTSDITVRLQELVRHLAGPRRPPRRGRGRGCVLERGQAGQPRDRRSEAPGIPIIPRGEMLAELLRLKYA